MTLEEAVKWAAKVAPLIKGKCWSVAVEDLQAAALEGYLTARARFKPPGDFGKYARAYMRGSMREVLRQEARAHGLTRPSRRHCKKCGGPLPHSDKIPKDCWECKNCNPNYVEIVKLRKEAAHGTVSRYNSPKWKCRCAACVQAKKAFYKRHYEGKYKLIKASRYRFYRWTQLNLKNKGAKNEQQNPVP